MIKPNDPLEGPKLKIERANTQITEIASLIKQFSESQPYEFFEAIGSNGNPCLKARIKTGPPAQISVVVGDVLHNLRSALDQLACALAIKNGGSASNTYFPFAKSREIFETSDVQKKIKQMSAPAV